MAIPCVAFRVQTNSLELIKFGPDSSNDATSALLMRIHERNKVQQMDDVFAARAQ